MKTTDPELRKAMYKAHKGKCYFTGRKLSEDNFHIDHIVPKAKGGKDEIENYVLCDPTVNVLKSDKLESEKIERILYLNKTLFVPRVKRYLEDRGLKFTKRFSNIPPLPCPDCGKFPDPEADIYTSRSGKGVSKWWFVKCQNPDCLRKPVTWKYNTRQGAVWHWNYKRFKDDIN